MTEAKKLVHFGQPLTGLVYEMPKPQMRIMMRSILGTVKKNLGTVGFLKFLLFFPLETVRLSRRDVSALRRNGLKSEAFLKTQVRHAAFYSAVRKSAGPEKARTVLKDIAEMIATRVFPFIIPRPEDFQQCADPFNAFREWLLASAGAEQRLGTQRFDPAENADDVFQLGYTFCAWHEIPKALGLEGACASTCIAEDLFFRDFCRKLGIGFLRTGTRPGGAARCDFRFDRMKNTA